MKKIMEIWDPIIDFYKMRKNEKGEMVLFTFLPAVIGGITFLIGNSNLFVFSVDLCDFYNDILNQLITVLALFISFCMAYLSILLTSSSKNVDDLKKTKSTTYKLEEIACSLYQVNACEVTYVLLAEIIFLIIVFAQKLLGAIEINILIKIFLCADVAIFIHILLVMLIVVKNMYYSFWKNE